MRTAIEGQVAALADDGEGAFTAQGFGGNLSLFTASPGDEAVDDESKSDADQDDHGGREHHVVRTQDVKQLSGNARSKPGAQRHTDPNRRKETLALLFGVDVVRKRPELCHDKVVVHTKPQVEEDALTNAAAAQYPENEKVRNKRLTVVISLMRPTRADSQPNAGTTSKSRSACPAAE